MAEKIPERFGIRPHASRKAANLQMLLGGVFVAFGAASAFAGFYGPTIFTGMVGLSVAALGLRLRRDGAAAQILNRAYHAVTVGEVEDAELLHRLVSEHRLSTASRRSLDLQRCILAIRAGELEAARAFSEAALEAPLGWLTRDHERIQQLSAHSLRAFVRAANGEADAAMEDVEQVRAAALAGPDALARVELAVAVSLQKAGRRGELRAHLASHRQLLGNYTHARERALVRGLERMLAVAPESVYRRPAKKDPPKPDGWIAKVLPGVASYVPAGEGAPAPLPRIDADEAQTRRAEKRLANVPRVERPKGRAWKTLLLWVLLIVMLVAIYKLVTGSAPAPESAPAPFPHAAEPESSGWTGLWIWGVITVVCVALVARLIRRNLRAGRRLVAAMAQRARGDVSGARSALLAIAEGPLPMLAAEAKRQLASLLFNEGDLTVAQAQVDAGIGAFSAQQRAYASDMIFPNLLEDRAVLLAAAGQLEEAEGELALLLSRYGSYPFAERARRRVRLMMAVRSGDFASAAQVADASVDVVFSEREDLLVDLARAVATPEACYPGEVERLRHLLEGESPERAWLRTLAPDLLAAFDGRHAGDGIELDDEPV